MSLGFRLVSARELVTQAAAERLVLGLGPDGDQRVLDLHSGSSQVTALAALAMTPERIVSLSLDANAFGAETSANATDVRPLHAGYLPFPDASFEVILSPLALCCFPQQAQRARLMREIVRVLKPGGRLMMVDPCDVSHYPGMLDPMQPPITGCSAEALLLFPRLTLFQATIGLNSSTTGRLPVGSASDLRNNERRPVSWGWHRFIPLYRRAVDVLLTPPVGLKSLMLVEPTSFNGLRLKVRRLPTT